MFHVEDDKLYYDDILIGPSSALYLAHKPDFKGIRNEQTRGIVRATLPPPEAAVPTRCDIICVADGRVVGFESKHAGDLLRSHTNRRLSRQLFYLLQTVGVACLLIRGQAPEIDRHGDWPKKLYKDLVRWQQLGVLIVIGPEDDNAIPEFIAELRPILAGKSVRGVLAWQEKKEYNKGYLLRSIPGIGQQTSEKLIKKFGTVREALLASDESWKKMGLRDNVIRARHVALD